MLTTILGFLNKMHLDLKSHSHSYGWSCIKNWRITWISCETEGKYALMMGTHCIANRKTLAMQGANKYFLDLNFIDQTSN